MSTIIDAAIAQHEAKNTGIAWGKLSPEARQELIAAVAVKFAADELLETVVAATGLTPEQTKQAVKGLKQLGYLREMGDIGE